MGKKDRGLRFTEKKVEGKSVKTKEIEKEMWHG